MYRTIRFASIGVPNGNSLKSMKFSKIHSLAGLAVLVSLSCITRPASANPGSSSTNAPAAGVILLNYDDNPFSNPDAQLQSVGLSVAVGSGEAVAGYFFDRTATSELLGVVAASSSVPGFGAMIVPIGSSTMQSGIIRSTDNQTSQKTVSQSPGLTTIEQYGFESGVPSRP